MMADLQLWKRTADDLKTFSFYNRPITNIVPSRAVNVVDIFRYVTSNYAKKQTIQLRAMTSSTEAKDFETTHFDYCTFSGLFHERNKNERIAFSNLMCLSFDQIKNIVQLKRQLLEHDYFDTELMFTNPRGDGVKWIILIDLQRWDYSRFFRAVSNCTAATGLPPISQMGNDMTVPCFLPYDPEAFIHPKYDIHVKENILRPRLGNAPF